MVSDHSAPQLGIWLLSLTPSSHYSPVGPRAPHQGPLPERSPLPSTTAAQTQAHHLLPLRQAPAGCPVKSVSRASPSAMRCPQCGRSDCSKQTRTPFTLFLGILVGSPGIDPKCQGSLSLPFLPHLQPPHLGPTVYSRF